MHRLRLFYTRLESRCANSPLCPPCRPRVRPHPCGMRLRASASPAHPVRILYAHASRFIHEKDAVMHGCLVTSQVPFPPYEQERESIALSLPNYICPFSALLLPLMLAIQHLPYGEHLLSH